MGLKIVKVYDRVKMVIFYVFITNLGLLIGSALGCAIAVYILSYDKPFYYFSLAKGTVEACCLIMCFTLITPDSLKQSALHISDS
jgi:hypothetical protein